MARKPNFFFLAGLLGVLLWCGAAGPVRADVITTTDGKRYEGKITEENDRYMVVARAAGGEITVWKSTIKEITRDSGTAAVPQVKLFSKVKVTTSDGKRYEGRLVENTDKYIVVVAGGSEQTIWKNNIAGFTSDAPLPPADTLVPARQKNAAVSRPVTPVVDQSKPEAATREAERKQAELVAAARKKTAAAETEQKKQAEREKKQQELAEKKRKADEEAARQQVEKEKKRPEKKTAAGTVQDVFQEFCKQTKQQAEGTPLRWACDGDAGDAYACYQIGRFMATITETTKIKEKNRAPLMNAAIGLLEKSCDQGIGVACCFLAKTIEMHGDQGTYGSLARAYQFYEKGCTAKFPSGEACGVIGYAYAEQDRNWLASTGLTYRPDLWLAYLERGCRFSTDISANEGKKCCEMLATAYQHGNAAVRRNLNEAQYYREAMQESEKKFTSFREAYKKRWDEEVHLLYPYVAGAADKTTVPARPTDLPSVAPTTSVAAVAGMSITQLANLSSYTTAECAECKRNRDFQRYWDKAQSSATGSAPFCAAVVLTCCYLKAGLFKEKNSTYELGENELIDILRVNRQKAEETGPCIFTCDYEKGQ